MYFVGGRHETMLLHGGDFMMVMDRGEVERVKRELEKRFTL
jgi:hypothetical protein